MALDWDKVGNVESARTGIAGNRFSASVDNYQAGLYGLGEALAPEGATQEWMRSGREANEYLSDAASRRASAAGAIDSYKDVTGPGSALNYAAGLGIQSLPYLAESAVGGLAARGLSTGLRAASAAGDTAAATALTRRAAMGGAAISYPSSVGDILGNQREQLRESGQDDRNVNAGSALVGGVPYAAANYFSPLTHIATGGLPKVTNLLDSAQGLKGGLSRMGTNAAIMGVGEGANELSQEFVNQGFGRMAVDPNETFFNDKSNSRFAESFVGGAALGGFAGGAAGGWRRSENYVPLRAKEIEAGASADLLSPSAPENQIPFTPVSKADLAMMQADNLSLAPQERYESGIDFTPPQPPIFGQQTVDGGVDIPDGRGVLPQGDPTLGRPMPRQSVAVDDGRSRDMFAETPSAMVPTMFNPMSEPSGDNQGRPTRGVIASGIRSQLAQRLGKTTGIVSKLSLDLAEIIGDTKQMSLYIETEQQKQQKELEKLNRKVDMGSNMLTPQEYDTKRAVIEDRMAAIRAAGDLVGVYNQARSSGMAQEGAAKAQPGVRTAPNQVSTTEQGMRQQSAQTLEDETTPDTIYSAPNEMDSGLVKERGPKGPAQTLALRGQTQADLAELNNKARWADGPQQSAAQATNPDQGTLFTQTGKPTNGQLRKSTKATQATPVSAPVEQANGTVSAADGTPAQAVEQTVATPVTHADYVAAAKSLEGDAKKAAKPILEKIKKYEALLECLRK